MAVAGSQIAKDWYDDFTLIQILGHLRKSHRFSQSNTALQQNLKIKQLIGHSLGSSVILEKQKSSPDSEAVTYNAIVLQMSSMPQGLRYRSTYDPVSMFDKGAKSIGDDSLLNPKQSHNYTGNSKDTYASNTILPNGNQNLIE